MTMGMGMAIGLGVGAAIGLAIDNLAVGVGMGIATGAGLGWAYGEYRKKNGPYGFSSSSRARMKSRPPGSFRLLGLSGSTTRQNGAAWRPAA